MFKNDILHSKNNIDSIKLKQNDEQNLVVNTEERIKEQEELLAEIFENQQMLDEQIKEVSKKFADIETEVENIGKSFDNAESRLNALYIKQSEYKVNIISSELSIKETEEQLERDNALKGELQEELADYDKEITSLKEDMDRLAEIEQEQVNKIDGYMSLYQNKLKKLDEEKQKFEDVMQAEGKTTRVKLLIDLENSMEGFAISVKEIIRLSKSSSIKGIHGTIVQLIRTEDKYATAVETLWVVHCKTLLLMTRVLQNAALSC